MELSIVIVNWNSKDFLDRAVASVQTTTRGLAHEIIVIDSGSFDGSAEMLRQKHSQVRFIQAERNLGFAAANNEACRLARGGTLLFLNPDTAVVGSAIEQLYRALQGRPDAGIVGPTLRNSDGSVQDTCIRAFPTLLNQLLEAEWLRRRFPAAGLWGKRALSDAGSAPQPVDAVSGACLMIRRPLFEAVGGFSTDYFMYSEDLDLCLKARRAGFQTCYVPQAVVVHHGGGSSTQAPASTFAAVMLLESRWRFFRKTRSRGYAALYRAAMCGASVARIAALALAWPVQRLRRRQPSAGHGLRRWTARLRWSLGAERWARVGRPASMVQRTG